VPRLQEVPRAEAPSPLVTMMYDFIFGAERDPAVEHGTETGSPGDWWTVFANSPDVFEHAVAGFGLYQSPKRKLPPVLRELVQTRVGWTVGSKFVFSQHCKSLRGLDVSEERIAAVPGWQAAGCFSDEERLAMAYADYLVYDRGRVPEGVFNALRRFLDDEQILERTSWWWAPGSPGCTCSTVSGSSACRPRCSTPPATWGGPGTGTATPAPGATSRPPTTPTASIPSSSATGPGRRSTPPSPRSCPTCASSPIATTCAATSSSPPASSRPSGTSRAPLAPAHRRGERDQLPLLRDGHGCLSLPKTPDIEGTDRFRGEVYFTSTPGPTRASTSPAGGWR
jgi:alkylhydroperoxidase family enzyme